MQRNTSYTPQQIVNNNWTWTSGDNGGYNVEQLAAISAMASAQYLARIADTLQAIRRDILALGSDGLHEILRDERAKRRKVERLKRARAAKKRAATIARKKAAAQ